MTFDWRPKGIEGTGQVAVHEKSIPGRGKNMCRGPKMKACWACLSDLERAVCSEQKGQGVERGEVWTSWGIKLHWAFNIILKKKKYILL